MTNSKLIGIAVSIIAALGLIIGALAVFVFIPQSVLSEGNRKEATLSSAYVDGANILSGCVNKTRQTAGVAKANAEAFDRVIKDAVAGNGAFAGKTTSAGFVPILVQTYPDLSGQTDLYKKVADVIVGCQDDFRTKQSDIQDKVRDFQDWMTGSWRVRTFGGDKFPNKHITVTLPGLDLSGEAAWKKIRQPIVNSEAAGAYQEGTYDPEDPFAEPSPSE